MKRVTKTILKKVTVAETIETFETSDRHTFFIEQEALDHETLLDYNKRFDEIFKLKQISFQSTEGSFEHYLIYVEEINKIVLAAIYKKFGYHTNVSFTQKGWNIVEGDTTGDYNYCVVIIPVEEKRKEFETTLINIKDDLEFLERIK